MIPRHPTEETASIPFPTTCHVNMYPAGITLGCDLAVTVAVAHPVLAYILSTGIPYRRKIISLSIYTPMRLIEYEFLSDFQRAPNAIFSENRYCGEIRILRKGSAFRINISALNVSRQTSFCSFSQNPTEANVILRSVPTT